MIYLDHAATTPMDQSIIDIVTKSMSQDFANSGTVYQIGLDTRNKIEKAREKIMECLKLPSNFYVVFVSGGTEANNLFIKGTCGLGKPVAALGLEHSSVFETLKWLSKRGSPLLHLSKFHHEGRWTLDGLDELKKHKARLLCLSHVNNEVGSINDPVVIGDTLKKEIPKTKLFFDGVQAIGKLDLPTKLWDFIDGYSISGHKINGPKGIGVLIYDSKIALESLIHGGKQQLELRSGTLPTPLILGMAESLKRAVDRADATREKLISLRVRLIQRLKDLESKLVDMDLHFNSNLEEENQSPAILNFSFPPVEGEPVLHHLEKQKIYVGLGSACNAHSKEPSKILAAMGCSDLVSRCSLRISFGRENTIEDIDNFVDVFGEVYKKLFPIFSVKKYY